MADLTRKQAKEIRSALRASLLDQEPKGQWPWLRLRSDRQGCRIESVNGDVALRWQWSDEPSDE